jgi:hypothetical protein
VEEILTDLVQVSELAQVGYWVCLDNVLSSVFSSACREFGISFPKGMNYFWRRFLRYYFRAWFATGLAWSLSVPLSAFEEDAFRHVGYLLTLHFVDLHLPLPQANMQELLNMFMSTQLAPDRPSVDVVRRVAASLQT